MIEFLSNWAKSLGLAIIVISILEMILPNNKTKKYVRMIFGLYIIFNIIGAIAGYYIYRLAEKIIFINLNK